MIDLTNFTKLKLLLKSFKKHAFLENETINLKTEIRNISFR